MKQEDILYKTAKAHDKEVKKSDLVSLPGSNVPKTETTTAPSNAIILLPSNGTNTDSDITNAIPDADGSDPADVKVAKTPANEPTDSNAPDNRPSSSDSGPFLNPLPPLIDLSSLPGWKTTAARGRKPRPSRVPSPGNNGVPGTRSFSSCVGLLAAGNNTSRVPSPVRNKGLPGNKGARSCFSSCRE